VPIRFAAGEEGVLHGGEELAMVPGRAFKGRRRSGSLTGWAHLTVKGRQRADWAGKGGRRWAVARLEKKGGGGPRLGWKRRVEAELKPLLGQKSKRVKENQF
jgi:hypothetical protein